jgi:hypothetical protein
MQKLNGIETKGKNGYFVENKEIIFSTVSFCCIVLQLDFIMHSPKPFRGCNSKIPFVCSYRFSEVSFLHFINSC